MFGDLDGLGRVHWLECTGKLPDQDSPTSGIVVGGVGPHVPQGLPQTLDSAGRDIVAGIDRSSACCDILKFYDW